MGGKLAEKENERALRKLFLDFFGKVHYGWMEELADSVIQLMKENQFAFLTQHQIASYQVTQAGHLEKAFQENRAIDKNYCDLTNEILENSCESCFDGDESAHQIAINYVRFLEEQLSHTDRKAHKEGCYYTDE